MSYPLRVWSPAQRDLAQASQWYERRSRGLGAHFVRCVDAVLLAIARNPEAYHVYHKQFYRALIHRFPFGVFFVLIDVASGVAKTMKITLQ